METTARSIEQARAHLEAGRFREAYAVLDKALRRREDPNAHLLASVAAGQLGRYEAVTRHARKVLAVAPNHPGARMNLANALTALGETEEAIRHYRALLGANPNDAGLLANLGHALHLSGRHEEAIQSFERALALQPRHPIAHHNLGKARQAQGDYPGAAASFERAVAANPRLYEAWLDLGFCQLERQALAAAETAFRQASMLRKEAVEPLLGYALAVSYLGRNEDALAACRQALAIDPDHPGALSRLAWLLERKGDHEEALDSIRLLRERGSLTPVAAETFLNLCHKHDCCADAIAAAKRLLADPNLDADDRRLLHFGLGKLLDRLGDHDRAFDHIRQGNELTPYPYDEAATEDEFRRLKASFTRQTLEDVPRSEEDGNGLIFIVGMPRSGTSLTEQILAAHPEVFGAGELPVIADIASKLAKVNDTPARIPGDTLTEAARFYLDYVRGLAPEARRARVLTDKMPHNFLRVGLIACLFPKARIIHCVRNPADTCLSIYFQQFGPGHPYATDLGNLGRYYRLYLDLMAHWEREAFIPIHRVRYEELVTRPEENVRRLLDFAGLEWDDRCMDFHKSSRYVATASYDQVRQKIYTGSVERWRRYERQLQPLLEALGDAMPDAAA